MNDPEPFTHDHRPAVEALEPPRSRRADLTQESPARTVARMSASPAEPAANDRPGPRPGRRRRALLALGLLLAGLAIAAAVLLSAGDQASPDPPLSPQKPVESPGNDPESNEQPEVEQREVDEPARGERILPSG